MLWTYFFVAIEATCEGASAPSHVAIFLDFSGSIGQAWLPGMDAWNKTLDFALRFTEQSSNDTITVLKK